MKYVKLENGVEVPQLGFGVFQVPPQQTKDIVLKAIEAGSDILIQHRRTITKKVWEKQLLKAA